MKRTTGWIAVCVLGFVTANAAVSKPAPGPVKVFILAGQSNMEGHGGLRTMDELGREPTTHGALLKKIRNPDGSYVVRDDVFISYQRGDGRVKGPLTAGQGVNPDFIGPELMFGIEMGDYYQQPVLLIKTAWGGKDLYCDFRPPGAGKPAYEIPGEPRPLGAFYRKMVEEVHQCLDKLDTDFPQLKGRPVELVGFVWFQGWNDMCADGRIKQQVFDEYASNFGHLVQDLRAEFKAPKLLVAVGEVGVGGELAPGDKGDMAGLRAAQARIKDLPELKGSLGYVRTAPYWYPDLFDLPRKVGKEESRVRKTVEAQVKQDLGNRPDASDKKKVEEQVNQALGKALEQDDAYQKAKAECDRVVSHWECHYQGSARVYCMVGYGLAQAMKDLLANPSAGSSR